MRAIVTLSLLLACATDGGGAEGTDGPTTTGDTTPTTSTSTTTSDVGPGSSSEEGSTSTTADPGSSSGEPEGDPAIHWVGRHDASDPAAVRMSWSGSGFVVRFDGSGVAVSLDDQAGFMTVVVDGEVQPTLTTTPGMQTYPLAADLPPGRHVVELYRRTEGNQGTTVVHDVTLDGELLAPPSVERRIEIIGDSISAGYGNEGVDPCDFTPDTENHYLTYGAVAARELGAEVHTIAWSGKGMVHNFGGDTNEPMPEIYDRTIAAEPGDWTFAWQPDAVVVNLGTNDFSTDNDPTEEMFVTAYIAFVEHLRDVYPDAFILVVTPSLFGLDLPVVEGYLGDIVAQVNDPNVAYANINAVWMGSGCNGHPNVATHAGMAANLVTELEAHLGW